MLKTIEVAALVDFYYDVEILWKSYAPESQISQIKKKLSIGRQNLVYLQGHATSFFPFLKSGRNSAWVTLYPFEHFNQTEIGHENECKICLFQQRCFHELQMIYQS